MNRTQLMVLWIGIGIIVLMGFFPPAESHTPLDSYAEGYSFIMIVDDIAFSRLFVQWAIVAAITGGLLYTLKDKKKG